MSDLLHMIILAIVQGLTEFLPVSSSGHLVLAKELLGFEAVSGLGVELLLHLGTLVAVFAYYRRFIGDICVGLVKRERPAWIFALSVIVSMIPAVALGLLFEDELEHAAESPRLVACLLMVTGLILLLSRVLGRDRGREVTPGRAFLVGIAQAFAMLPGISRSGSTISMARVLGIASDKIASFSFLMVVPVILGGNILHLLKAFKDGNTGVFEGLTPTVAIAGLAVSGIVGYLSVAGMVKLLTRHRFWLFGFYCLAVGIFFFFFS